MKKMKRYNIGGGMGDSNEGMKDAYDARIADEAKAAADKAKAIADEAKAAETNKTREMRIAIDDESRQRDAENEGSNISEGERVSSIAPSKKQAPSKPRVAARTMPKAVLKDSGAYRGTRSDTKASPVDETKLSLSDRFKLSRDRSRSGSGPTDTRSVSQRLRAAFGMKKGGEAKKMASGGSTSSASKRADGIASKGKTRGKMC
jgi:hypothetical protein